jgi:hypothetical protein
MKPSRIRRAGRGLAFGALVTATLVALFYAEEDWRGARIWAATKRDLQARGESFEWRDFVPPRLPEAQNLAFAPLFRRAFPFAVDPKTNEWIENPPNWSPVGATGHELAEMPWGRSKPGYGNYKPPSYGTWLNGEATDLDMLQRFFRRRDGFPKTLQSQTPADDVLFALSRWKPLLTELAQAAAERPLTRFPVAWTRRPAWSINLPHYPVIRGLTDTLCLRASAELATGETSAARADILLALRLRQANANDPIVVGAMVDTAELGDLVQPIWEGLAARQWSADDLDAFSAGLRGVNVLRELQQGIRGGERAAFAQQLPEELEDWGQAREIAKNLPAMTWKGREPVPAWLWLRNWLWRLLPFWPRGWYEQNVAMISTSFQKYVIDPVDPPAHRITISEDDLEHSLQALPLRPSNFIGREVSEVFASITIKFAFTQNFVDQTVTACALEKYYLDHQAYPAGLAALAPRYLDRVPNDVIDGAPLRYRLTVDGRYQLYSIGSDQEDGGGLIEWPAKRTWRRAASQMPNGDVIHPPNPSKDHGDWVWQYAPTSPPDPPENGRRLGGLSS